MALPVINETPKYTLTIPSTKKKVTFRPFLVKEQKVLLMSVESNSKESMIRAIADTVKACVEERIDVDTLATFDLEYMFAQIRAKSVGETSEIYLACTECGEANEVIVNVENAKVDAPKAPPTIKLNDRYSLKLKYPNYNDLIPLLKDEEVRISTMYAALSLASLGVLMTDEEQILFADEPLEERSKFLDNLNPEQFQKILDFVQNLPKLKDTAKFKCGKCEHQNEQLLEGLEDFF